MADKQVRLGVAGLGRSYERLYLPVLKRMGLHDSIVAVAEPDPRRRANLTPKKAREFARFDDLVERGGIDAVIDLSPPGEHLNNAALAIQAGVQVLSERPFALDPADLRRLQPERAARFVTPVWARRFWPDYQSLREERPDTPWLGLTLSLDLNEWKPLNPVELRPEQDLLPELFDLLAWIFAAPPATVEARTLRHSAQAVLRFEGSEQVITVTALHGTGNEEIIEIPGAAHMVAGGPRRQWRGRSSGHEQTAAGIQRLIEAWLPGVAGAERHAGIPSFADVLAAGTLQEAFSASIKAGGAPVKVAPAAEDRRAA